MGSELEVDEWLNVGRLDLDDDKSHDDDEKCFDEKRALSDIGLHLFGEELWHEMQHITQQHQQGNRLVGGTPLKENLRFKLEEYLMEHLFGNAKRRSTEEHPQGCNEVEGDETSHEDNEPVLRRVGVFLAGQIRERTKYRTEGVPHLVETEEKSMNATPEDEVEGCSVPETTQQHRHQKVEVLAQLAVTVATEGDIEIVLEP